jgi:hypothetical protein
MLAYFGRARLDMLLLGETDSRWLCGQGPEQHQTHIHLNGESTSALPYRRA